MNLKLKNDNISSDVESKVLCEKNNSAKTFE